jgi:N-acetylglucosaminyl-diphospho-decaprenol L-rhamnosyltransferase
VTSLLKRIESSTPRYDLSGAAATIDAVTVSTNDVDQLEGFFSCEALGRSFRRIIVVDNDSTDGTAELARSAGATVVRRKRGGYGAAINTGAQLASGTHLAVLNPDIRFFGEDVVPRLMAHFEDPTVGIAAPALQLLDGRLQDSARRTPTPLNLVVRRRIDRESGVVRQGGNVDWVVGACFIVRRDLWDSVGGFDPSYFLYFDDVDLCTRVRRAGGAVRFDPTVVVEHAWQGASRKSLTAFATRHHIRSATIFFARNPRYLIRSGRGSRSFTQ